MGHDCKPESHRVAGFAAARGYGLIHRARPVSSLDFPDFDLVIAMDDENYEALMH